MKTASLSELKTELTSLKTPEVIALCMRLAKYKRENKELLTYLLFEANDEEGYVDGIKAEIDLGFEGMNRSNLYFVKKSLRKTLRIANKYIKYSGSKQTEVEILLYLCKKLRSAGVSIEKSPVIHNLYQRQIQRIKKALSTLHEDLQYDYKDDLEALG
ncbi:MAG: hypothetical protein EHM93_08025 [Bacteroidales bacterium]|nr:MAG: hypothetical protein EHM93_08025 [Bacteroidales bacterium]